MSAMKYKDFIRTFKVLKSQAGLESLVGVPLDDLREGKDIREARSSLREKLEDLDRGTREAQEFLEKRFREFLDSKLEEFSTWKASLEGELENLPRYGLCEFCGKEDKLERHHWETSTRLIEDSLVCHFCNSMLTSVCPLVELCGGFPPREVQRAYIREVVISLSESTPGHVPKYRTRMETMKWLSKKYPWELDEVGITLEPIRV